MYRVRRKRCECEEEETSLSRNIPLRPWICDYGICWSAALKPCSRKSLHAVGEKSDGRSRE